MRAKLQQIKQQLRSRMHHPVAQTGKWLKSVVQGYFNYHAVPGNIDSLGVFRERVTRLWRRTLLGRSQKHRLPWTRMHLLAVRWLPQPRVLHPYPESSLRRSVSAIRAVCANRAPVRICAGGTRQLVSLPRPDATHALVLMAQTSGREAGFSGPCVTPTPYLVSLRPCTIYPEKTIRYQ